MKKSSLATLAFLALSAVSIVAEAAGGSGLKDGEFTFFPSSFTDTALLPALLNFAILIGLLLWKARPPINQFVQKKHDEIRKGLEEGARLRSEAEAKLAEYGKKIEQVDAEVESLISDIRKEAEAEKVRILQEAARQAEATKRAAEARIAAEIQRARHEIEREVAAVAVAAAEKALRAGMQTSDHSQLIDSFVSDLQAARPEGSAN